jgi:hypothetical protein
MIMVDLVLLISIIYMSIWILAGIGMGIKQKDWRIPTAVLFCCIIPFFLGLML